MIDKDKNTHYNVFKFQGGVHNLQMHREKMAGVNLRDGIMEVAFEQWTERTGRVPVGSNVFPRYRETVSEDRHSAAKAVRKRNSRTG